MELLQKYENTRLTQRKIGTLYFRVMARARSYPGQSVVANKRRKLEERAKSSNSFESEPLNLPQRPLHSMVSRGPFYKGMHTLLMKIGWINIPIPLPQLHCWAPLIHSYPHINVRNRHSMVHGQRLIVRGPARPYARLMLSCIRVREEFK